jgi:glycogen debranching enzyme
MADPAYLARHRQRQRFALSLLVAFANPVGALADSPGVPPVLSVGALGDLPPITRHRELQQAVQWLEREARRLIQACRRPMADGRWAFPPQVGSGYEAFWLRDYAYMVEACPDAFTETELRDCLSLFLESQAPDGSVVDCVTFDGKPIYKPGMGSMGQNPVADGPAFLVGLTYHTHRRLQDRKLLETTLPRLQKALTAVPRHPRSGLVFIDPAVPWDRCGYGFTDTVRKQGEELFCSLLLVQACRQMAELLREGGQAHHASCFERESQRVAQAIRKTFWDDSWGLFRAATVRCREPDLWGSAFAVFLGVAEPWQARRIADYFAQHYPRVVQRGQLRHLPAGLYWEAAGPRDQYQNGGFWAVPVGWLVETLDLVAPQLAEQTVLDLVHDAQRRGFVEWSRDDEAHLPHYVASATAPLPGIRRLLARRVQQEAP